MSPKIAFTFLAGATAGAVGVIVVGRLLASPDAMRTQLLAKPEFIADHPEILARVQALLLSRKLAAEGSQRMELMRGKWRFLTHAAFTPTLGPADAPRVLLEFTDYTCSPCRASAPAVRETLAVNKDLRVAVLLYPTGGALAEYAARIALAAYRQDPERFAALHTRLMEQGAGLSQESILGAVRDLGFDVDQIERESGSDETRRYLNQVRLFSEELEISAVPAFVLNDKLMMGGVGAKQLKELIGVGYPASPSGSLPTRSATAGRIALRANASVSE